MPVTPLAVPPATAHTSSTSGCGHSGAKRPARIAATHMITPCAARSPRAARKRSANHPQIGRLTTPATWYTASARPAAIRSKPARLVRCTVMNEMKHNCSPE